MNLIEADLERYRLYPYSYKLKIIATYVCAYVTRQQKSSLRVCTILYSHVPEFYCLTSSYLASLVHLQHTGTMLLCIQLCVETDLMMWDWRTAMGDFNRVMVCLTCSIHS